LSGTYEQANFTRTYTYAPEDASCFFLDSKHCVQQREEKGVLARQFKRSRVQF